MNRINNDGNRQLLQAINLALRAHGKQVDKAGMPYILHPLHVMNSVDGIDAKTVAVLHDVIEDTKAKLSETLDMIRFCGGDYHFSKNILETLDAISKRKGEKNIDYWNRVKANPLALQVKLKDIEHNSSEERLAALSLNEADYLRTKYAKALEFLRA